MVGARGRRGVAMVSVRTSAAAAAVMVLGLTGCTGGDKPAPSEPAKTVAAVSPTPTPTVIPTPTLPAAAKANTPAGAEAFVRYVLNLYTYTYLTGNTGLWRDISTPDCGFCKKTLDEVIGIKNDRQHSVGDAITVHQVLAAPNPPPGGAVVVADYDEAATRIVDDEGKVIHSYPPLPGQSVTMVLEWRRGRWAIFGLSDNKDGN